MTERNDTSKISPTNPEYDVANVDDRILNYTKQIRKNMFTDNITEAMARVAELAGLIAGESSDTAKYVKDFYDEVLLAWESDPNKDPEVIAARGGQSQLKDRFENTDRQLAQNTIQVSVEEPDNALIWYEDKGKAPINFENNSGINIQNAELSKTEPTDTQKLWFDKN